MNSYTIPEGRNLDALRQEAAHYLKPAGFGEGKRHDERLHVELVAGPRESESYLLERRSQTDGTVLTVRADGARGAAHGFHHVLRLLGFGFSFFDDATPRRCELRWPTAGNTIRAAPAFGTRGFLPWGNLLNSIDAWNFPDWERYLLTLWRWGCNFLLVHSYDHEPLGAFRDAKGRWSHGKPRETSFAPSCGAPQGVRIADFHPLTRRFFRDARHGVWGARNTFARDPIAAAQAEFRRVIAFARTIGLDVGFGFELTGDPTTPGYRQLLARRIRHVLDAYPGLHTLCLWQSESLGLYGWKNAGCSPGYAALHSKYAKHFHYLEHAPERLAEAVRLAELFRWSYEIAKEIRPSIRVAFSGWGGDRWMRWGDTWRGLHELLPADVVFSQLDNCLPRWQESVSESARALAGQRETWTTLWLESDGGPLGCSSMWHPQDDVSRMNQLARSAARLGYTGLLAQHWNTAGVEPGAACVAEGAWHVRTTTREFRRRYVATFFTPNRKIAGRAARIMEELEALGPGWTGTSQHVECGEFSWDSFPGFTSGRQTPRLARLGNLLHRVRGDCFRASQPDMGAFYRLDGLLFQLETQDGRPDAFEILQRLRCRFAALGLKTPHARRLRATMDFVIGYEKLKRLLDSRGRLPRQQALIRQARTDGLRPDPRLVAQYRHGLATTERLWREVFRAQVARLDTRSDLGNLAIMNLKAYQAWKAFRKAM